MRSISETVIHHVLASKGCNIPAVEVKLHSLGKQSPYFSVTNKNGCDHERIAKRYPRLQSLIALHLCGIDGAPMYAEENGFYHYAEGVKDNGKPCYFPSEDAKKTEEARLQNAAFLKFQQIADVEPALARDVWESVAAYRPWKKDIHESALFKTAQRFYDGKESVFTQLVVARNNEYLASHLRISLEEAAAIPAGLTKAEFITQHVEPHRVRWQAEATAAIDLLKEWEALYPPFDDEAEEGKTYYFGAENYKTRLPEIRKRREEQRAYSIR